MLGQIFNFLGGGIVESVKSGIEIFTGNKAKREEYAAAEDIQRLKQFAKESQLVNRTWWDSLVDGINRLVRPLMTFGTVYLFYHAMTDPESFGTSMQALVLVPPALWGILAAIITFWFGGKFLGAMAEGKYKIDMDQMERVLTLMDKREEARRQKEKMKDEEILSRPID